MTVAAVATALFVTGCSSKSPNAGAPAGKARVTQSKTASHGSARAEKSAEVEAPPKSVFTVDNDSRDPFFPNAKKAAPVVATAPNAAPKTAVDVLGQLQAGFQGILVAGDQRIGLINNVMLEPGRETEIPVGSGNEKRRVPVRCREVTRDGVVLEVQGYAQPVRIASASN